MDRGQQQRPGVSLLLPLFLGCALLIKAGPMAVAELGREPHRTAISEIGRGAELDEAALRDAAVATEAAQRWRRDGRTLAELGQVRCALARLTDGAQASGLQTLCIEALREAQQREAVLPHATLQLAYALAARDEFDGQAQRAFQRSVATGPALPPLVLSRVIYAIGVWGLLDADSKAIAQQQIVSAAWMFPGELRRLATSPARDRLIRATLARHPEHLQRYLTARPAG